MWIDEIFKNFKNKLKQEYEKDQKIKNVKDKDMDDNNSNNSDEENDDSKKIDKILFLNKETFYSVLLNIKFKENIPKLDKEIKGINLVSDITNKQDIDLDENLNINNLVNINSERVNLGEDNTLSLYDSSNKTKGVINVQKFENTSMISDVNLKEKLEVKIPNPKKIKLEENKEATDDRISSNSLIGKEKNINEILELISSNSSKYSENKKIMENSKESESNENLKNKKKVKLSLIDKENK